MKNSSHEEANLWMRVHPDHGICYMDHLYNQLDAIYPHRWNMAFKSEGAIQTWRERWSFGFIEDRLTHHQVAQGIDLCHKHYPSFPPNMGEFIALCKQVKPMAHRDFVKPKELERKLTREERAINLARLHESAAGFFEKHKA